MTSWTRETVRTELIVLLGEHAQAESPVSETSHLVADLGIDSLGMMEIMAAIEDKFALKIPDEALLDLETVADVIKGIEQRLGTERRLTG